MKKRIIKLLVVICLLCVVALTIASCKGVKMTISFVVDGETYATIDTSGNEMVTIPQSPSKDGYTFDGWYWDNGTWQRPFTANSLLNEPLTADMSVYAKFTEIHTHTLTLQPAAEATCTKEGNSVYYTCTCGQMFADERSDQELTAIPTINKIDHTPTEWITDSEPTCTANGSKHTECSVCHTTLQTEAINASGHTPETEWKIDSNATCTVDGSKHLECSVCHATLQTQTIPSTGHTYSTEWASDERGHWHVATCEHKTETTKVENHTYDKNYKCKVCNYQDTSLHGTAIATEIFDVDGETLYAKVPNAQTTFSFINAIQVADDATFIVATDLAASNVIRTKTVSLEIGDNTYYVLVENGNDIQLYTVTLRRRPIYTVTFATNGGTACDSQLVEEDSFATEPTTTKTGYTFASWDYDFEQAITANTTITASWTVNEYTITYDANGGELAETEYNATYDSAYTLAVPTREGHTFLGWYIGETQIADVNGQSISSWTYADNKTVTAKWSINSYTLTIINPNSNAGAVTGDGTIAYNSEVTVTATEPNLGYEWLGWYIDEELITTELDYSFNIPAMALSIIANYKVKNEMSNFNFTSTATTCEIKGVINKTATEMTIPEYITSIGASAFSYCSNLVTVYWNATTCVEVVQYWDSTIFRGCSKLTAVVIGDNVTKIPSCAFYNCSSITSVTMGDSVATIGASAFYNCSNLTSIVIPDSVTSIDNYAFGDCSNLETVYWHATSCTQVGSYTGGSGNYAIFGGCSKLTAVVMGDNVTEIPSCAFYNCSSITSVTMGDSVATIGASAFYNCSNLTSVYYAGDAESWCNIIFGSYSANPLCNGANLYIDDILVTELVIPDTITEIKSYAFYGYTYLTSITIPDSVMSIGESAFFGCGSLTCVTIGNGVTTIGASVFRNCSNLINVVIPNNVTTISLAAFAGCSSLENITLPFIGGNATDTTASGSTLFGYIFGTSSYVGGISTAQYYSGYQYATFYIPASLKDVIITGGNILRGAFYNCNNLTSVTIADSVTEIGYQAFYNCSSLTSVTIPENVILIGESAFCNCSNLETVYWNAIKCESDSFTNNPLFSGCTKLTSVVIGDNVAIMPGAVFYGCSSLTSVTIGNSVATIGVHTFRNCSSLTSITIPGSIASIDYSAFYGCSSLTSVYYTGNIADWCNISFSSIDANPLYYAHNLYIDNKLVTELAIPDTVTSIKSYAFYGCTSITSITIPDSVSTIGSSAFNNCSSLETVYWNANACTITGSSGLFSGCSKLTTVVIGNNVITIPSYAFSYCSNLTSITIPDSVTTIGSNAFQYCSSLTSITIGNSVKSIGDWTFKECSSLTSVYYKGTADDWANISIGSYNTYLTNATRYYYSETEPALSSAGTAYIGNYWHYIDGEVTIWKKEN